MPGIKKQWLSIEEFEKIQGGDWTPGDHTHVKADITDTPWAWADVSKVGSNLTDLATRQHAGLTGVGVDDHHNEDHAAEHEVGGGDLLAFANITGFGTYIDQALLEASSPTFVTVKLSGLTDGYVPYHVDDATGLADSPIRISGANMGIGTVPTAILHTDASIPVVKFFDAGLAVAEKSTLRLGKAEGVNLCLGIEYQQHATVSKVSFHFFGDTFGDSLVLQKGGKVGIGTINPTAKLDVGGVDGTTSYIVERLSGASSGYGSFLQFTDGYTYNFSVGTHTNGDFAFYSARYPGNAGTERMRIAQGGAVTIPGTLNSGVLTCPGLVSNGIVEIRSGNDLMLRPTNNDFDWRLRASDYDLHIIAGSAPTDPIMVMNRFGQVGVGKTPTCELDVDGTIKATEFYVKLDDLLEPDDNIDLNVSIARHGLFPKLSNNYREFFSGTGQWYPLVSSTGIAIYVLSKASTTTRNSNDTERNTTSSSWVKLKETKLGEPTGVMRIYFEAKISTVAAVFHARIYRNGEAIGTIRTDNSIVYIPYSEDLGPFDAQDLIQIYGYRLATGFMSVRNFRFQYDRAITYFGDWEVVTPIATVLQTAFSMQNQDP